MSEVLLLPEKAASYSIHRQMILTDMERFIKEVWFPQTGAAIRLEVEGSFIKAHYKSGAVKYFRHPLEDTPEFRRIAREDPQMVIDLLELPLEMTTTSWQHQKRKIEIQTGTQGKQLFDSMLRKEITRAEQIVLAQMIDNPSFGFI